MLKTSMQAARRYRGRSRAAWRAALDGLARVGGHELVAAAGHWAELRERLAVARQARSVRDLVAVQVDLLAETRVRLALDQRERVLLLRQWARGVLRDLRAA